MKEKREEEERIQKEEEEELKRREEEKREKKERKKERKRNFVYDEKIGKKLILFLSFDPLTQEPIVFHFVHHVHLWTNSLWPF